MEGDLQKWSNYVLGWQKKHFCVREGVLYYSNSKGGTQRGLLHLDIAQVALRPGNPRRFSIDTGMTCMHLKANSKEEAQQWVDGLKKCQEDLKTKRTAEDDLCETLGPATASRFNQLYGKIGEMWSIHAEVQAAIDALPKGIRQSTPGLDRISHLCGDLKVLASDTLKALEDEGKYICSQEGFLAQSAREREGQGCDSEEFEDALSHWSEEFS